MRGCRGAGLAVGLVTTGLLVVAAPAASAQTTTLYVANGQSNCSDTGSGTQAQPFCTIGAAVAAVQPGQTINVTGTYNEHVTTPS